MTSGCYVSLGKPKTGYDRVNVESEGKRREEKTWEERNARELQIASTRSAITHIPTSPQASGDLASTPLFSVPFMPIFFTEIELEIDLRWRSGASNCDCTSFELQLEIVPLAFFQCVNSLLWCWCTQIIVESDYKGVARDNSIHNSKVLAFLQFDFLSSDDFQANFSGESGWEAVCCWRIQNVKFAYDS